MIIIKMAASIVPFRLTGCLAKCFHKCIIKRRIYPSIGILHARECSEKKPKAKIYERHDIWASDPDPKFTEVEEVTGHWHFVERLLPENVIPDPPKYKGPTPSGWTPPPDTAPDRPYFVARTSNHLMPVYMTIDRHDPQQITMIRHIQGDIWALERDLREELQKTSEVEIMSGVHEFAGFIKFKGDYVNIIKDWLVRSGF